MSRAVFLPTPGDPFLVSSWLRHFQEWRDLVDTLYVYVAWPQDAEVIARLTTDIEQAGGTIVRAVEHGAGLAIEHGAALNAMLDQCVEKVVFMCEDDLYVHDRAGLEAYFERVERYEGIIGTSRGSMSGMIHEALCGTFPKGAGLWPYLVARTWQLRQLTEPFGARWWEAGETIKGVGYTCPVACTADTFGATAMEIRGRFPVIEATDPPWVHAGSLSSGPATSDYAHVRDAAESWRTRLEWWERFYNEWPGGLDVQHAAYGEALDRLRAVLR